MVNGVAIWEVMQEPNAQVLLQAERLRLFARVAKTAPPFLLALIQSSAHLQESWGGAIRLDLQKLWESASPGTAAAGPPAPDKDPKAWQAFACKKLLAWKHAVRRMV